MTFILKSKLFAMALALATPLTFAGSVAFAPPAEAGIISSVKSAVKTVGGAVKTTAKGIGAAAKAAAAAGKQVGVGVGSTVKRGAVAAGKGIAKYTPVGSVVKSVKVVVNNVRKSR
jgi:hypothetical protein